MSKAVLIPIPKSDFDPTESAVPWKILRSSGVNVVFATPDGTEGICDLRMLSGAGLGPLSPILSSDENGRTAYHEMVSSTEFKKPGRWVDIEFDKFDGLILPGGHAKGMREYLESPVLFKIVQHFFETNKPVGAICHGVVLAARSRNANNQSVLHGRKTTALLASQELMAWAMTCAWLGDYYRTYKQTVESEVKSNLASLNDFQKGPMPILRDSPTNLGRGFVVQDRNYLSARWPGDAHLFGKRFLELLK